MAARAAVTSFLDSVIEAARTTAILFFVPVGAPIFRNFVNLAGLPDALQRLILDVGVSPLGAIVVMIVIYVVLGCFLESLSMVLLTVPIFFPLVIGLGFDPIGSALSSSWSPNSA